MYYFKYLTLFVLIGIMVISGCDDCEDKYGKVELTSLSPNYGRPGDQIKVIGVETSKANKIIFGDTAIDFTGNVVIVPSLPLGVIEVRLGYKCGNTQSVSFTVFQKGPSVDELQPSSIEVGKVLTIVGRNFTADAKVFLNDHSLDNMTFISSSQLKVLIPLNAVSGNINVEVDEVPSGAKLLTIINPYLPKIDSIWPLKVVPGETVLIFGKRLYDDQTQVTINETEAAIIEFPSDDIVKVSTSLQVQSGILKVSTKYGSANFAFLIRGKDDPVTNSSYLNTYAGDTLVISGKNFFPNGIELLWGYKSIPFNQFRIPSEETIHLFIPESYNSNMLRIKTTVGEASVYITVLHAPYIEERLPQKNPINGPLLISGSYFDHLMEVQFEGNGNTYNYSINSNFVNYLPNPGKVGILVPELPVGSYLLSVKDVDNKESNKVEFEVTNGFPSGLPSEGANGVMYLPNLPPGAVLNSFNNNWNLVNLNSTINFYDDFTSRPDSMLITGSFNSSLSARGYYLTNGKKIEITFGEDGEEHMYRGSLDLRYSEGNVYRVILTPVVSGKQIEMIFPVGLEKVSPSTVEKYQRILIKGKLFLSSDYKVEFTNDKNEKFEFSNTNVDDSETLSFYIPDELPTGLYTLRVIEPLQERKSNSLSIRIID